MSLILDTCPQGQKCGGSDAMSGALMTLIQSMMGTSSSTATVCYPTTP
jgi:hypothetical protein